MEWTGVLTAIVALYGAVLSTYTLLLNRKDKTRQIGVKLSSGFLAYDQGPSPAMLFIEASNPGNRAVTLSIPGIGLPDGKPGFFFKPLSNVTFPHALGGGESCSVWTPMKEFASKRREEGYKGKVRIVGFYRDQPGKEYRSKKFDFDIDDLRE